MIVMYNYKDGIGNEDDNVYDAYDHNNYNKDDDDEEDDDHKIKAGDTNEDEDDGIGSKDDNAYNHNIYN